MNKVQRLLIVGLLFVMSSAWAAEYSMTPPTTGYELLKALQREDLSVKNSRSIQAVVNTVMAKGYIAGMANVLGESQICPPGMALSENVYVAVRAYLEQHTAQLSGPPYPLVKQALIEAFPCK